MHSLCLSDAFIHSLLFIHKESIIGKIYSFKSKSFFVLTRLHLICTYSPLRIFFMNLLKENMTVSRQNNNDTPQTYIFWIKTCRLLPYTLQKSRWQKELILCPQSSKSRFHCIHVLINAAISYKITEKSCLFQEWKFQLIVIREAHSHIHMELVWSMQLNFLPIQVSFQCYFQADLTFLGFSCSDVGSRIWAWTFNIKKWVIHALNSQRWKCWLKVINYLTNKSSEIIPFRKWIVEFNKCPGFLFMWHSK